MHPTSMRLLSKHGSGGVLQPIHVTTGLGLR